ncbi:MAG: 30S ribosomal protein S2 [Minisyncoccia bacterium]
MSKTTDIKNNIVEALYSNGVHFGFIKSRRHPSVKPFIYGVKNKIEIFDLEKTAKELEEALSFIEDIASKGGKVLFVGGKNESREAITRAAESVSMPFVAGRFIGGTLTNFPEIKKRVEKLESWVSQKEKGELVKYTKKERLLIDREIDRLREFFSGLSLMKSLPQVVFVVDAKKESIAVTEAKKMSIPVVALCGSDNNLNDVDYAIPGNDASKMSIEYILGKVSEAYKAGTLKKPVVN